MNPFFRTYMNVRGLYNFSFPKLDIHSRVPSLFIY